MTRPDEPSSRSSIPPCGPVENNTTTNAISPVQKPRSKLLAELRAQITTSSSESDIESEGDVVTTRRSKPLPSSRSLPSEESSDNEDDSSGEGAYERMKKRLMLRKSIEEPQKKQTEEQNIPATTSIARSSSEEEDDVPVRAKPVRRLISRKEKTASPPKSPSPNVRSRQSSPGLFVTPNASPAKKQPRSSEEPSEQNADLEERIQRIRAARLAKQREEINTTSRRSEESDGDSDVENRRRLTQHSKPTRRAGKKAMEAMARDQQRISRNMGLTHQARTKKKFSTKDLFAKFGFNHTTDNTSSTGAQVVPDASSVLASSDAEAINTHDTPPSSPPSQEDRDTKDVTMSGINNQQTESLMSSSPAKLDKGKGRAPDFQHLPVNPLVQQSKNITVQNNQVDRKTNPLPDMIELSDSEDDLEIIQPKSRFPVFDRLPQKKQKEAPSLLHLRHLAHLTSPGKSAPKGKKPTNMAELQFSLAQKARQQAQQERQERIEELRLRGIHVETEEEREKRQMEIEDLVAQLERAREEDRKLAKMEKEEAKKNGEIFVSSDESEDDDYAGSGEDNESLDEVDYDEGEELELSGSSDEEMEDEEASDKSQGLIDDQAAQDDQEEPESEEVEDDDFSAPTRKQVSNRSRNVIVDDEDESGAEGPEEFIATHPATQDEAMAAFGFGKADVGLGLTQMFAGTMADLESVSQTDHASDKKPEQDSLDFLRSLPATQPGTTFSQTSDMIVPNSQSYESQPISTQAGPDTQFSLGISQLVKTSPAFSRTQLSELPEPTQDAGFELSRSPAGVAPLPSTMDTVVMSIAESPILRRKGKLHRGRREEAVELSDADDNLADVDLDLNVEAQVKRPTKAKDVFSEMKKAAKKQKAIDDFNKKTSWAKDAVDEQAEESEDEYAGLGGASDDESGEEDADLKQMIDNNDVKVDERQLAAFYADKAKAEDQKNINQLYKDLLNGGLRKRAGRDAFDMSDSEDEAELRRRRKQAEFRKMTKALVQDEKVGKIAQNPKQAAFFQTLADHMDDPDYDFLNAPEDMDVDTSQDQSQENQDDEVVAVQDSQANTTTINPLKRKSPDSQKENRPPPNLRRTAPKDNFTRKPLTLADVQHSVSELLEDSHIIVPDSQYSESEGEEETPAPNTKARKPIIDRLSRTNTSSSESTNDRGKMAFHAPSTTAPVPGFRIPSLIRRTTSNFSSTSERSSGANTPAESGVRRGGTGKSNIHAQAREAERRAVLEKKEAKRKDALRKKVDVGRKRGMRSVLGTLGGEFE